MTVLLVLSAPLASALEEGRLRDLRVRGGITPASGTIRTENDFPGLARFDADLPGFDRGYRFSLGFFESFGSIAEGGGSVLLGLSFATAHQTVATDRFSGDGGLEADVLAVDGHVGYALPLDRHLHLEALAFIGGGGVRITDHTPTFLIDPVTNDVVGVAGKNRSRGNGPYYEGGLSGGAYYTFANGLQIGVDAGVLAFSAKATVDWLNARSAYAYRGVGGFGDLSLGLRF